MAQINDALKNKQLHPYLLVVYFIVYGIQQFHPVPHEWMEILGLFLGLLGVVFGVKLLIRRFSKNMTNANIGLTGVLLVFLLFLPLSKTLSYLLPQIFEKNWQSFIFLNVLLLLSLVFVLKRRAPLYNLQHYLNVLFLVLPLTALGQYAFTLVELSKNKTIIQFPKKKEKLNIYLFVPDGYAASRNLKKYLGYDNTKLTDFLAKKKFYIPQNPRSNYSYTVLSVSSFLSLNYIPPSNAVEWSNLRSIDNNLMRETLTNFGYDCHLGVFNGKHLSRDKRPEFFPISRYYFMLTSFYKLGVLFFHLDYIDYKKDEGKATCTDIMSVIGQATPQYVYLHTMNTHAPFANESFDVCDTSPCDSMTYKNKTFEITPDLAALSPQLDAQLLDSYGNYLKQIENTDIWLIHNLEQVWSKIEKNSIVIVMSDHGFRNLPDSPTAYAEKFQNFCAVYFPDQNYGVLNDSITPVNLMRIVMNKATGTQLPYLPDEFGK